MPTPNAAGLRSRKVDFKKPLLVFRLEDIPEKDQGAVLSRNIPIFATGVEKEEEEEHHLQAALIASQNHAIETVVIPTPDASKLFADHPLYYTPDYVQPQGPSLIRFSAQIEDCTGPLYNLDEKDEAFLHSLKETPDVSLISDTELEELIWELEMLANERHSDQGPSLQDWQARLDITRPQLLSKHSPKLLSLLFDYWKQRRFVDNCGRPLQPNLRNEDVSLKPDSDPYVCFRRRELKPQRKLRRDDGQSLEKLKKLRDELLKAKELLELVALRETTRKESLALDMQLFEQKCVVRKLRKKLGLPCIEKDWDTAPLVRPRKNLLKKGPFGRGSEEKESSTKIRIPMRKIRDAANLVTDLDPSGQYSVLALTTEENVKKKKLTEEKDGLMDVTEDPYIAPPSRSRTTWHKDLPLLPDTEPPSLLAPTRLCFGQRRIGRGGRLIVDRHMRREPSSQKDRRPSLAASGKENEPLENEHYDRFAFDHSSEEVESEPELLEADDDDMFSSLKLRCFNYAPREDEYKTFMNKALHPERLTIQPAPLGYRPPSGQPPPQVIRAPAPQVKRKQSKSSASGGEPRSSGSGTGTTKKKGGSAASPAVDSSDRSAAVKAMMQQAQKQAQQTQLQIQQFHSNVAGEPGSPSTELSGSTSKLQSPTPGLLSTYGGGPAAATLLQQQQQLARKQQQLRMQHQMRLQQQQQFQGTPGGILFPMPDGVAGLKGPSSLTPQQLQMYYAQKAQANGSGNTAKTAAVQNAFPLPMKSASSSIATVGIGLSGGEVGSANGTAATSTGTAGRGTGGRGGTKKDAQQKQ